SVVPASPGEEEPQLGPGPEAAAGHQRRRERGLEQVARLAAAFGSGGREAEVGLYLEEFVEVVRRPKLDAVAGAAVARLRDRRGRALADVVLALEDEDQRARDALCRLELEELDDAK